MEMLKVLVAVCFAAVSLNLAGFSYGKPILEKPKVTRIEVPRAIISREQLVALAQYAIRMMASRINITLQATSQADSRRPVNVKQVDQKVAQTNKIGVDPSTVTGRSTLTYEPFVRYPNHNVGSFPSEFDFEIIPNSQISSTYIPQTDESGRLRLPVQKTRNNPFVATVRPVTSVVGEKDLPSSNIRIRNLTIERIPPSQQGSPVLSVPFEAVITFTRQKPTPPPKLEVKDQDLVIPTRDPPDDFPPYFDTVLTVVKNTTDSQNSLLDSNQEDDLNPVTDRTNEVEADKKDGMKPMGKRQTPRLGELLEMLGISTTSSRRGRKGGVKSPTPSSLPIVQVQKNESAQKASGVDQEETTTTTTTTTAKPQSGPTFQRQEIDEDEEEEDDEGSLGSIAELLPLIIPVLEDLSDPNTETDIGELLQAGLPLVQGISQGTEDDPPIDFVGILSPIIASLSRPNSDNNGTVLQSILPLIVPLVTPFIGPIVGPIIQSSNNPADLGGSSITPIIQSFAGPLSLPTQPGGISIASSLISGVIASLSRDLKPGRNGGSDIGALVSTVVSGVLAGGSAGLSGASAKPSPPPRPQFAPYGQGPVPASSVDPLDLVGTSIKDILGLSLQLVKSVISSVTGILGASSAQPASPPVYGPPNAPFRLK